MAGIHQPPLSLRRVLRNLRHVAARLEQFLRGQNAQERHFHRALHADFLFFCLDLRELHIFSENRTAQAQFSAQDHRLLHEEALLSPADRAAANLIARVAGRWIRIEPRLLLTRPGRADFRLRLPQSGIRFVRDFLRLLERDENSLRVLLRSPHPRVFRFHRWNFHVLVLLLFGHLHFLRSRGASRCQHACNHHRSEFPSDAHVVSPSSL